ncbi:MAG TPA: rod shape-determining protein MreC [Actinomycetota bacterium]|nr:rod shape-determining protein MreC [Actinomycetota bacterium]
MALRNRARSTRLLVVSLVSASLITITIDYRGGDTGPLAAAGDATLTVITPLQEAVSKVTRPVGNFFSTLVHLPAIRRENEQYKETIAQLQQERSTELADRTYIQQLEDLLDLDESLGPRVETTAGHVVANAVSNFEWTVTIDKGSSDGVEVDMPVVAAAGLVGHVIRVTPSAAVVRLIIDPDSAVAGRLDVSGESGLLEGQGQGDLTMDLVRADAIVQPNEHVVTAGYRLLGGEAQSLYPPNILIGTVSRVISEDNALQKFVTVRPAVDFSTLNLVLVVLSSGRS